MLVGVEVAFPPLPLRLSVLAALVLTLVLVVLPLASLLLRGVLVVLVAMPPLAGHLLEVLVAGLLQGVEPGVAEEAVWKEEGGC